MCSRALPLLCSIQNLTSLVVAIWISSSAAATLAAYSGGARRRIYETVGKDRATASWLMRRSIRTGSINYVIDRNRANSVVTVVLLYFKNAGSLVLGIFRSLLILVSTRRLLPATHPFLTSLGRTVASLGFLPKPYEASAIPPARLPSQECYEGGDGNSV